MKWLTNIVRSRKDISSIFFERLQQKLGYKPKVKWMYRRAFTHRCMGMKDDSGKRISFERLEFLGDALLTAIVSEHLFTYFPDAKEGALTLLRSKMVSRQKLNEIGQEMGLLDLLQLFESKGNFENDICGNLLEALVGAVFIDRGFLTCKHFVLQKMVQPYFDISALDKHVLSYKSKLLEWAQKEKEKIVFNTLSDKSLDPKRNYFSKVFLNDNFVVKAHAVSKKKAEEKAARSAFHILKLDAVQH